MLGGSEADVVLVLRDDVVYVDEPAQQNMWSIRSGIMRLSINENRTTGGLIVYLTVRCWV